MDNDSNKCENPPKRQRTLRKRKSFAEPSTSRFNYSDLSDNNEDFESSGEYGDVSWIPAQSDLDDYDEDVAEISTLSPMEQKIIIATDGQLASGIQSQYVTLCTATTVNSASEQTTVSNTIENSSNIDDSSTVINTVQMVEDIDVNIMGENPSSNSKLYTTFIFEIAFLNAN